MIGMPFSIGNEEIGFMEFSCSSKSKPKSPWASVVTWRLEPKHSSKVEVIIQLSKEMEKDPDAYYAISISECKIVAKNALQWELLHILGQEEVIKIGLRVYDRDDIFVYCPNEIWFNGVMNV